MDKIIKITTIAVVMSFVISSCSSKGQNIAIQKKISEVVQPPIASIDPVNILASNCYLCHDPNSKSHDNLLAPPMTGVKYQYMKAHPDKNEFVNAMTSFIMKPDKSTALLKKPVKQVGLMPPTILSEQQVQAVVNYLYDNEINTPLWFADHFEEENGTKWEGEKTIDQLKIR
jgi:hypothetical protein